MTFHNPILDKEFTIKEDEEKWYNLSSGRKIGDTEANRKKYIMLDNFKITGTKEEIQQFIDTNKLDKNIVKQLQEAMNNMKEVKHRKPKVTSNKGSEKPIEKKTSNKGSEKADVKKTNNKSVEKKEKKSISKTALAKLEKEKKKDEDSKNLELASKWIPKTTNVRDIPEYVMDSLCDPDYRGLIVEARVARVIDGDTIYICFYLPSDFITRFRKLTIRGNPKRNGVVFGTNKPFSILQLVDCRLSGIDAAEHDTEQGVSAINKLRDKFASLNDIIYVKFIKYEKFGRSLIEIYPTSKLGEFKDTINYWLTTIRDKNLPEGEQVLAVLYDGNKKCQYMKQLKKIEKSKGQTNANYVEQARMKKGPTQDKKPMSGVDEGPQCEDLPEGGSEKYNLGLDEDQNVNYIT